MSNINKLRENFEKFIEPTLDVDVKFEITNKDSIVNGVLSREITIRYKVTNPDDVHKILHGENT